MHRKCFTTLAFALLLLTVSRPISGCGAFRALSSQNTANLPLAFSQDQHRPNYGGDLKALYHWTQGQKEVTYRFPATATDIRRNNIPHAVPGSTEQVNAVREAFRKWETASERRIRFREVSGDQAAHIDIVFVPGDELESGSTGSFQEPLGRTALYIRDIAKGELGRAVIQFSADITGRPFRLVALHEIGHSTGLWGHSRQLGDIMFSTKPPNGLIPLIELTERDRNTTRANYAP